MVGPRYPALLQNDGRPPNRGTCWLMGPVKKMARQKEKVVSSGPFPGQSSSYAASGDGQVGVLGEGVAVRADTASPAFSKNGPGINT